MATIPTLARAPLALHHAAGLSHPVRGVARGELIRVREGIYADATEWSALRGWERYLARVHAVAMQRPDAVFCLESACALLGLPVFRDPTTVHVLGGPNSTARDVAGVRMHSGSGDRHLIELETVGVTSPADTAVDVARHRHPAVALAVADAALRTDPSLTAGLLAGVNELRVSSRGRDRARDPLSSADGSAESPLESVSRIAIRWLGFPAPELQKEFSRGPEADDRGDFWWPDWSLLGEADGDIKYDGSFGDPARALRARRERDIRLETHVRAVTHWGWLEATTFAPLRNRLLAHGLPLVSREDTAALLSMRRLLGPR
ncbi:hypothetical protein [Microbacterium sp. SLBN-146]|uniref:type IV toxin-antitoxin system AbiEi family antitoxin domain-containing protein n=1 Tax=Microbacterium sp. SLBN-146 TaxID=2768457 RepID=UPI001152A53B|nr:hypothetical protein [Microbacterium sp. SLBN-146]TQJ31733.1 hypothetical protein FBY39_2215 [Microbacterium sp. SLBN-146]